MILYVDKDKISFCEVCESGRLDVIIDGVRLNWDEGFDETKSAIETFKLILEA
jgi:hypothetical protein